MKQKCSEIELLRIFFISNTSTLPIFFAIQLLVWFQLLVSRKIRNYRCSPAWLLIHRLWIVPPTIFLRPFSTWVKFVSCPPWDLLKFLIIFPVWTREPIRYGWKITKYFKIFNLPALACFHFIFNFTYNENFPLTFSR